MSDSATTVIRIASMAPVGTTWHKVLLRVARDVKKRTDGSVRFKIYPGGRQGTEKMVVAKMRSNQLQAAALTAGGMAAIDPAILVMQLPFLIRRYSELDHVAPVMLPEFDRRFQGKGFKLLGLGDIGFVYTMSSRPFKRVADLRQAKVWVRLDDPIGMTFSKVAGVKPQLIAIPGVLPSLRAGKIDTVHAPPLAAIVLQWYTQLKYIAAIPVAVGLAGTVIRRQTWDALTAEQRAAITEVGQTWGKVMQHKVRRDNRTALQLLLKNGLQIQQPHPADRKIVREMTLKVHRLLAGKIYPTALYEKLVRLVLAHRKAHGRTE